MFGASKKIEEINSLITELSNRVQSQNIEIAKLKESNDELTTELDDSRNNLKQLSEDFKSIIDTFRQADNEIMNEVTDLKLFFSKTKKDILNELTAEFSREMKEATANIYADMESFRELKKKADELKTESSEMKSEIIKFIEIAGKVNQADFELSKYAKLIEEGDKEKLDLLRKIDALERLIAKQRRIQH